ncbi:hypothetical protein TorRG33x02_341470 [Trema orientale]|uniref:Uncharacterized protein n=1 Tax=Trema orientale TaxID=63057 RepID=A0A2P5ATX9_TREOI|nr:hypothetical protein TorRG33x02_341470 [Trema orientale]
MELLPLMAEASVPLCYHQLHHHHNHQHHRFLKTPPEGRRVAAIDLTGDDSFAITAEAVSGGEVARTDYGMYNDVVLTGYIHDPNVVVVVVVVKVSKAHVSLPRVVKKEDEAMLLGRWFYIQS